MDAARFFAPDFVDSGGMPLKGLECQVSNLVNSDPCPRPTTDPRDYHDRYRTSMKQAMLFVSHRADPDVQPAACRRFDEAGDASVGRGKRDVPTRALADRFSCEVSLSDDDVFSTAQILYGATKDKAHLRQVTMRLLAVPKDIFGSVAPDEWRFTSSALNVLLTEPRVPAFLGLAQAFHTESQLLRGKPTARAAAESVRYRFECPQLSVAVRLDERVALYCAGQV